MQPGEYKAKALEIEFGTSSGEKKSEQCAVSCQILEGPNQGKVITWYGYFSEKTTDRTLESLMHMGWNGEDLTRSKMKENGFGSKEFRVVLEEEEYKDEKRVKVQWINADYGTAPALKDKMDEGAQAAFANKYKGAALALKKKKEVAKGARDTKEEWDGSEEQDFKG